MIQREKTNTPKKRILSACVRMFIERGFRATTMQDIIKEADVSAGTFQNIFRTKDGVLSELAEFMFSNQFGIARGLAAGISRPAGVYAVETAIQFAITEENENLREIYIEAYTVPQLSEYIYQMTSTELKKVFGTYNPDWADSDFYEAEIGTAGMMRAYMARPCDKYFTLSKKTERFLRMAFTVYHVPSEEAEVILEKLRTLDIAKTANAVMQSLFSTLEMTFDFKFSKPTAQWQ